MCFCGVFICLIADPKVLGYCEAQYDFSPMETNQIAFKVGDKIAILSKSRGHRGWWKGRIDRVDDKDGKVCSSMIFHEIIMFHIRILQVLKKNLLNISASSACRFNLCQWSRDT